MGKGGRRGMGTGLLDRFRTVVVRAASRLCALPLESVIETMRPLPVEPLASAPSFVRGVALIRDLPTPVVDLASVLDSGVQGEIRRFVTLRAGPWPIALGVEAVIGVRELVAVLDDMPPLLRGASAEAIQAIGILDAQLLTVLHAARLVPDAVWDGLVAPEKGP